MRHSAISSRLISSQLPQAKLQIPTTSGVYAYFLAPGARLGEIKPGSDQLLYVGMTQDGLNMRNHFGRSTSGFSTLRRSLGAILKDELKLLPMPRSQGASRSNILNYAFANSGEEMLSNWMAAHLLASFVTVQSDNVPQFEKELIRELEPPLNLTN